MKRIALACTCLLSLPGIGYGEPAKIREVESPSTTETTSPAAIIVADTDWPWWRGIDLDGKSRDRTAPTKWSKTENIAWKADVPGRGHASPIVIGDRVFLTTADESAQKQLILAFDRKTGAELWSTLAHDGGFMAKHGKNSHASATPACDGERVYSVFINRDGLHVTATDLDGKIAWQTEAGTFGSEHGYGSSPVLYKSLVIVLGDNRTKCFIAALDRATGKTVWRTDRRTTGKHGSYATPIVARVAGKPQLLVSGMHSTTSYDPETGKQIWTCFGPAEVTACTPAFSDQLVFSSGGYPEKELLAIRANGTGDISRSHVAWRTGKGVTYVPSPIYHAGLLYVVADDGVTTCYDGKSGTEKWKGRLQGNFSASPVLAGNLLYVTNEAGKTYVFKTGTKLEIVAQNDLGDGGFASPAICGGQIFLRTEHFLYCVGEQAAASANRISPFGSLGPRLSAE